jgi:hypothetical protein
VTRQLNRLTARMIATLKKPGRHADGGNLYVKVTRLRSAALSKSFSFMYLFEEKQREAGLGSCGAITLAQARDKAAGYRSTSRPFFVLPMNGLLRVCSASAHHVRR